MPHVHSFAPIASRSSRVLVLGSMPGKASLRAQQYYAHPHNVFWKLLGGFFGFEPDLPYSRRVAALRREGVALWDVMQSCTRESSLDSDIVESSIVPNDFPGFLARHRAIRTICFNGATAEHSFRKYVLALLPEAREIEYHRLPSTSPANASISYLRKRQAWQLVQRRAEPRSYR